MAFEFSHLLQPLSIPVPLPPLPTDPGHPPAPRGEFRPSVSDEEPVAAAEEQDREEGSEWIAALLAVSNDPPVADHAAPSWAPWTGAAVTASPPVEPTPPGPPALAAAGPRSRFATPSLDDDLLPTLRKRR